MGNKSNIFLGGGELYNDPVHIQTECHLVLSYMRTLFVTYMSTKTDVADCHSMEF